MSDPAPSAMGIIYERKWCPHETWKRLFESQGVKNPGPRIRMLDGFNEGWIDFEGASIKGSTEIETVLRKLVEQQSN